MTDFMTALALAIAIEGAIYALFPDAMKRMMLKVLAQPQGILRTAGLTAAIIGVGIVWRIRGWRSVSRLRGLRSFCSPAC